MYARTLIREGTRERERDREGPPAGSADSASTPIGGQTAWIQSTVEGGDKEKYQTLAPIALPAFFLLVLEGFVDLVGCWGGLEPRRRLRLRDRASRGVF